MGERTDKFASYTFTYDAKYRVKQNIWFSNKCDVVKETTIHELDNPDDVEGIPIILFTGASKKEAEDWLLIERLSM